MGQLTKGNAPGLTVGGRVFTDIANLIYLQGGISTASYATSPKAPFVSSGYAVPANKQLRITAICLDVAAADSNGGLGVGYCDNDLGFAGTTAPTNLKSIGGGGTAYTHDSIADRAWHPVTATGHQEVPCNIVIPAGKYVALWGVRAASSSIIANFKIYGYLESV